MWPLLRMLSGFLSDFSIESDVDILTGSRCAIVDEQCLIEVDLVGPVAIYGTAGILDAIRLIKRSRLRI